MIRKIIQIDEEKCNGCGACAVACHEGAIDMVNGKAKLMSRIKSTASIIFPLIFTSIGRIDTISNAMELRGYGKYKKRTWYMGRKLQRNDYLCIALVLGFAVVALVITYHDGSRFYNPFV